MGRQCFEKLRQFEYVGVTVTSQDAEERQSRSERGERSRSVKAAQKTFEVEQGFAESKIKIII